MASKIKEGFKELKDNAMNALRGPKYHGNLLGESLYDMMRQATSKALLEPDYDLNQQVIGVCGFRSPILFQPGCSYKSFRF